MRRLHLARLASQAQRQMVVRLLQTLRRRSGAFYSFACRARSVPSSFRVVRRVRPKLSCRACATKARFQHWHLGIVAVHALPGHEVAR